MLRAGLFGFLLNNKWTGLVILVLEKIFNIAVLGLCSSFTAQQADVFLPLLLGF